MKKYNVIVVFHKELKNTLMCKRIKEPYIILFDSFTGQGKSYVSKIILNIGKSVILNNDEIISQLNNYSDKNNLRNELQRYRLELLLNNNSCILDGFII